jgi:hypothetical protein
MPNVPHQEQASRAQRSGLVQRFALKLRGAVAAPRQFQALIRQPSAVMSISLRDRFTQLNQNIRDRARKARSKVHLGVSQETA